MCCYQGCSSDTSPSRHTTADYIFPPNLSACVLRSLSNRSDRWTHLAWEDSLHPWSSALCTASEGKYETRWLRPARKQPTANRSAAHLGESVCWPSWQYCGRGARCLIKMADGFWIVRVSVPSPFLFCLWRPVLYKIRRKRLWIWTKWA